MSRRPKPLEVAIVGMACRFPGAPDLFTYWENLLKGRVSIRDVPPDRWNVNAFYDPDSNESDRVQGRRGGYLDSPIELDPTDLGTMPRTIAGGEPEQFLILDAARSALADANLPEGPQDGRRVEVVIGRGNYFNRGNLTRLQHGRVLSQTLEILKALHPDWTDDDVESLRSDLKSSLPPFEAATIPGQLTNATAGRIAHRLGLNGPSYVVDAASASALVALELGARALTTRRADLAIIGAVYIEADVDFPLVFSLLGALSRSGRPSPFTKEADGLVPGEGVGVIVLKRLADAERDDDRVYAVVQGVGLASDGRSPGLAAPDAKGHLRAIRRAYRQSGIDPTSVDLIEGHGLGVPAADRAELRALRAAFPNINNCPRRVLGAVSALIGHAMPAAGMAGLIKSALALHHRTLPASPVDGEAHRLLVDENCSMTLNPTSYPWIQGACIPRRAGINAFGFAGINAHAVLEEHAASADGLTPGASLHWPDEAILLAALDREGLVHQVQLLLLQLRSRPDVKNLKDLAATLNFEAAHSGDSCRLGLVVKSIADLIDRLEGLLPRLADPACRSIRDSRGAYFWAEPLGSQGKLAFLFPGEGSQYPGMLADLCLHFPEVRALFDTADRLAMESGAIEPPSKRLFGIDSQNDRTLWESGTAVNLVLNAQWALYSLLRKIGLQPDAVAGHSSGEFLALVAAGAVEAGRALEDRFNELSVLFHQLEQAGTIPQARLVSVATHRERVDQIILQVAATHSVVVAIDNCPHQVILAGQGDPMERVIQLLRTSGISCEDLPFDRAYHTSDFARALDPIQAFFDTLAIHKPNVPIYSCCIADKMLEAPEAIRRLAVEQWTRPVEFRRTIEAMHTDGYALFVDVGARGNLAGFVEDTLRGRPSFAIAANLPKRSGTTQLNHLVSALFAQGIPISPGFLYARRRPETISLDSPPPARSPCITLELGFPEMKLSESLLGRFREQANEPSKPSPCATKSNSLKANIFEKLDIDFNKPSPEILGHRLSQEAESASDSLSGESAMLSYLDTMRAFLETQDAVMGNLLKRTPEADKSEANQNDNKMRTCQNNNNTLFASDSVSSFGPWAGELISRIDGRKVITEILLDAHDDPVAEHHTFGGRRVSSVDPTRKGLPVLPFTVMAEMLVEAAARLHPEAKVVGLRNVKARRWIRYEDQPIRLEVQAEVDPARPGEVRVCLYNRRSIDTQDVDISAIRPAVEGVVCFADRRFEPPVASDFSLNPRGPARFTAELLYGEQWLFHGPALQAVVGIGSIAPEGIEGTLLVLPRERLLRDPSGPLPQTDVIVLDAFTHLLGCWGLQELAEGDVLFPLRLGSLEIFGIDPPEQTELSCRINIRSIERFRVQVDAEIVRPDGLVWMRIENWEDWRFHWPSRYRDVFRQPDRVLLGEPITLPGLSDVNIVWLQPPADMGRPVWRDVLEMIQLSPKERADCLRPNGAERRRTLRLWGRIAAKEAARRLWLAQGLPPTYPGDLSILPDPQGRPLLRSDLEPTRTDMPSVSIAHTEGVAVALAALDPSAHLGIDVERILPRSSSFEALAFSPQERSFLDAFDPSARASWQARIWCAKEAVGKATGQGMPIGPGSVEILNIDFETGAMFAALGTELTARRPDLAQEPFHVSTATRGEYAWAWTIIMEVKSDAVRTQRS